MFSPLKIGTLQLASNVLLAPLSGYTDLSFRLVARSCGGVGLGCTDLLSPEGLLRENYRSMLLVATCAEDAPLAMQIYGGQAEALCQAARWAEDHGALLIDINMGCPVDRITRRQGGSALLCNPDNTVRMVEKIIRTLRHTPLTAKLRLGWDDASIVAPALARRLEEAGVAAITIHGRTTAMQFSGQVRLEGIAAVVQAVKHIPVIGNGDIRSPQDALHMLQQTGCQGVMIGRAALSAPWIFRDTWSLLSTGQLPPPLSIEEKCQLMRQHFENLVRFRGERIAVIEFRKRASWHAKQMHPCQMLKQEMRFIQSQGDFERVVGGFLDWRAKQAGGASRPGREDSCFSA